MLSHRVQKQQLSPILAIIQDPNFHSQLNNSIWAKYEFKFQMHAYLVLTSDIPNREANVLVFNRLHIKT